MNRGREIAATVVLRVLEDDAFVAAVLSAELERAGVSLDSRERGLATELAYGVIRTEPFLRRSLSPYLSMERTSPDVFVHLLVAAYQLHFLDRVPDHAVLFEAVRIVRARAGDRAAGFVNAVLRKFSRAPRAGSLEAAVLESMPSWLRRRLASSVGEQALRSLVLPSRAPELYLRLTLGAEAPSWLLEVAEPVVSCPGAYRYRAGGDPRGLEGFSDGRVVLQDLGSQIIARRLAVQPGERVLDVCAGRGNKTRILAEVVGPEGRVVATDAKPNKLNQLLASLEGSRLPRASVVAEEWDWTQPPPEKWREQFDAVLVDAPCSGVGTLRRRPEIARRLTSDDPARLGDLQARILQNARLALAPGGRLLFSTCSVLAAEGEDVLEKVRPQLVVGWPLGVGHGAIARLLPETHGSDGYFLAELARGDNGAGQSAG